jgi:DNA polymerase-3 subunit gamma/tau
MRELRENVRYRPVRDRYKVFIVDEAHQITSEAFNALLKTIEEPPPWAVFILCTTESHKIPATIASRCQHFSFRSVDFNDLIDRMREICVSEGIEADDEALSVIAQSGEGSVRDSLSALDQAIACCGNKLEAVQVRALLGAFSLDAMAQVSTALSTQDGGAALALVDELERNGGSAQHFSRELSRYVRNLLVTKISGPESRLVTASPSERAEMARIAAAFSEEDLTRYLQLALDLFRDLQFSLQPRFHLEIGLLKMIQAGKLTAIEEAIAALGPPSAAPMKSTPAARTASATTAGASPFEMDRLKKTPAAAPSPDDDWRAKLHGAMTGAGLNFSADAIAQSTVSLVNGELQISAPKQFVLDLGQDEIRTALKHIGFPTLRFKVNFGEIKTAPVSMPKPAPKEDEAAERALAHPEVQRFRELFGGEVRTVRNLKEPWNE